MYKSSEEKRNAARQYYWDNRERVLEQKREYYKKLKRRKYAREYYAARVKGLKAAESVSKRAAGIVHKATGTPNSTKIVVDQSSRLVYVTNIYSY
jgi:uncharacterized protein YaiL (DUF2058 family)